MYQQEALVSFQSPIFHEISGETDARRNRKFAWQWIVKGNGKHNSIITCLSGTILSLFFCNQIYIYTLGNFFFIYLPSARMQDHQRCVVAARFGCVVVCIVLSIGLLMLTQSVKRLPDDRTKKVNKAVSLQVTDSQSPLMVCQRSNKVGSTTELREIGSLKSRQ